MQPKEYIALDVGEKRTGIARASSIAKLAQPLKTVPTQDVVKEVQVLGESAEISAVIIGLPRNMSGEETAQTKWVKDWAEEFKKSVTIPVYFQDEALTSVAAEAGGAGKSTVDAEAASLILQDYLDQLAEESNA